MRYLSHLNCLECDTETQVFTKNRLWINPTASLGFKVINFTIEKIEMGKEIRLVILIEVEPGKAEEQINLYKKIRPLVLNEDGCLQYELSRVSGSDIDFVLTECWESEEYLALHDETPHMKEADRISPSFRAGAATVLKLNNV
jgi:quinol monooxygenase YgiN